MAVTKNNKSNFRNTNPLKGFKRPNSLFNNVFFYFILAFVFYVALSSFDFGMSVEKVPLNKVLDLINTEKVQDVVIAGDNVEILLRDGSKVATQKESNISFDDILKNNSIDRSKILGEMKVEHRLSFIDVLSPLLMFGFPLLILFFIFKQMRGANGDIMSFGKSRAKLFDKGQSKVTFQDVAGNEEAKTDMIEIVDFLKNPQKYRELGARIPKGILLVGPSGVGKTLLAKAIAGEAGVPFYSAAGSEFMEMLVGVGSSRVRDLFRMARETQPSLIFIDEIDAIGRQRGMGIGGGHDEREQTLNQILIEMDGFDPRTNVIVLAATNRPDMLDPALVRPGRFDRRLTIPLPDLKDREEILKIHMRGKPFEENFKVTSIARKTVGFSGADLENMLNESAILAARAGRKAISMKDVDEASLKVTIGSERRTVMNEEEKKIIAYHEAGHALVATNVPEMDEVARVSIIARGGSLGHTAISPERERHNESRTHLLSAISTMLAGRAAEELFFNDITVGASDDINKATKLAKRMVMEFGMSPLGPISFESSESSSWLARELGQGPSYSQEVAAKIDEEVKKIVEDCYNTSKKILKAKKETLDKVAIALLEKETLDGDEFKELL